jgi:fibronectin-binding autotransporter adhesin
MKASARSFALSLAAILMLGLPVARAATATWNVLNSGDASGSWATATNWNPNGVPTSGTADFTTKNITVDSTITLDGNQNIDALSFGDTDISSAAGWILNPSTPSTSILTLTGSATVRVNALGVGKNVTINAPLAGTNGLTKVGGGELVLTGSNSYTGITSINRGILTLNFSAAGAAATNIIAASGTLASGGGKLQLTGSANTTNSQAFAATTINSGGSAITLNADPTSNSLSLNLGPITRGTGGTVIFTLPTGTQSVTNGIVTSNANTNDIIGPWAIINNGGAAANNSATGFTYATVSGGNIIPYIGATAETGATAWGGIPSGGTGTINYDINSTGTLGATGLNRNLNTIRYTGSGARQPGNNSGNLLTINGLMNAGTGALTLGRNGANITNDFSFGIQVGTSNELVLAPMSSDIILYSFIVDGTSGASAVTVAGNNSVTFAGANTYTGPTNVNSGTLILTNTSALGGTAVGTTVSSGATLDVQTSIDTEALVVTGTGAGGNGALITSTGTGTVGGAVTLGGNTTVGGAGILTINGAVSDNGAGVGLTKIGPGTLTLAGANTVTGTSAVSAGTLEVTGNSTLGAFSVANTGALNLNVTSGSSTIAGVTVATGGTFNTTTASSSTGAVSIAGGGTLGIALTASGQTFSAPSLTLGNSGTTTLSINIGSFGSNPTVPVITAPLLTTNGTVAVGVTGALSSGTFTLIDYTGSIGGVGFGAFTLTTGALPARSIANLINNTSNTSVDLSIISDTPSWTGSVPSSTVSGAADWDIQTTPNWVISSGTTTYLQSSSTDAVIFNDTDVTNSGTNVNLTTTLAPAGITMINNTHNYTFLGSGNITGATGLTKSGTGMLIIVNTSSNTYTGATIINAGTVQIGDGSSFNAGSLGTGAVTDNGTLVFNKPDNDTLANTVSGSGSIIQQSFSTLTITGSNSYTGGTIINAGFVKITGSNSLGAQSGVLTINNATLETSASTAITTSRNVVLGDANSTIQVDAGGTYTVNGTISGFGSLNLPSNAGNLVLGGSNSFAGSTISLGGGTLTLANNNALSATTLINVSSNTTGALGGTRIALSGGIVTPSFTTVSLPSTFDTTRSALVSASGTNTWSGTALLNGNGNIAFASSANAPLIVSGTVDGNTTFFNGQLQLRGSPTAPITVTGPILMTSGSLQITDGVTAIIDGTGNSWATTSISSGILQIGNGDTKGDLGGAGAVGSQGGSGGTLAYNRTDTLNLPNLIGGGVGLTVNSGALILSNTGNSYTGITTINNGVLSTNALAVGGAASGIGSSNNAASSLVFNGGTLRYTGADTSTDRLFTTGTNGATLDASGSGVLTLTNTGGVVLSGSGARTLTFTGSNTGNNTLTAKIGENGGATSVTKTGVGTWVLTGSNLYTGPTNVNQGTLRLMTSSSIGALTVAGSANFGVTVAGSGQSLQTTSLTIGGTGTSTLTFDLASFGTPAAPVVKTGALTVNGATKININTSSVLGIGQFALIGYTTETGSSNLSIGALPARVLANLLDSGTSVDLNVTSFDIPKWTGATNNNWDIGTTATSGGTVNWVTVTSGSATRYLQSVTTGTDSVLFDDSAGVAHSTVNLTTTLTPISLTASNNVVNYVLTGTGKLSGGANITKSGSGSFTIANTGTNDYTGATTISSGTLQIGNGAAGAGSLGSGNVINNGSLTFDRLDSLSVSNLISGVGRVLEKLGIVSLSGVNTYSGGTQIDGGTLQINSPNSLGTGGAVINSGTLEALNTITTTRSFSLGSASSAIQVDSGVTYTISGSISDGTSAGTLNVLGSGVLSLSGSNSYSGGTNLGATTLLAGNASAFGTGALNLNGGATFGTTASVTIPNNITVTGVNTIGRAAQGTNAITLAGALTGSGTLQNFVGTAGGNSNVFFTGNLSGFTGTLDFTDQSQGSNSSQFWRVGSNGSTNDLSNASVVLHSGTVSNTATNVSFGFTDGITGATMKIGALSGDGAFQSSFNNSGPNTLQVGFLNTSTTFSGVLAGSAAGTNMNFTKVGSGTLILTGTNLYSGATAITGGTLQLGDGTAGHDGTISNSSSVALSNGATLAFNRAGSVTSSFGVSGSGSVIMAGGGAQTIGGANSYTGTTTVSAGTLNFKSGQSNIGGVTVANGANLGVALGSTAQTILNIPSLTTGNTILSFDFNNLNLTAPFILDSGAWTINGATAFSVLNGGLLSSGTHQLVSYGSLINNGGTLLTGSTYTLTPRSTGTVINANNAVSLVVAANNPIWTGSNSGDWDIETTPNWVSGGNPTTFFQSAASGTDSVIFNDSALTTNVNIAAAVTPLGVLVNNSTANYTFSSTGGFGIGGSGGLVKSGTGTLTLTTNNSYTGATAINGGSVFISADNNLGASGTSTVTLNGGTLSTTAGMTNTHAFTIGAGGGTINISGTGSGGTAQYFFNTANTLLGSGQLTVTGTGVLSTSGAGNLRVGQVNSYSGNAVMQNGGIFEFGVLGAVDPTATFTLNDQGELAVQNGVTLPNSITVNGGTNSVLSFENGNTGNFGGNITVNGTATVGLRDWYNYGNVRNGTMSGVISGPGSLAIMSGTSSGGTLTLTGSNTYTGSTIITSSTLQIGNGTTDGSIASSSNIVNNGALIYNKVGSSTYAGIISGTGSLTKTGAGAQTLSGSNSYTGLTTLGGGTIVAANTAAFGNTSRVLMSSSTTLIVRTDGGDNTIPLGMGTGSTINLVSGRATAGAGINHPLSVLAGNGLGGGTINFTAGTNVTSGTAGFTFDTLGLGAGTAQTTILNPTSVNLAIGNVTKFNNNVTQTVGLDGTSTGNVITGTISNGSATIAISKTNTSTWTISGTSNSYSGGTTITGGKLRVSNTAGSATGTGTVLVSGSLGTATLAGTGFISGATTVVGGGHIAPGVNISGVNSNFGVAGTISLGNTGGLTLSNASLDYDLSSNAATAGGGTNDLISLSLTPGTGTGGALLLSSTATFTFNELDSSLAIGTAYTLISGASSVSGFDPTQWTTNFANGQAYTATYSTTADGLQVTFAAVPEPGTWAMLLSGFGMLVVVRKRRGLRI